MKFEEKLSSAIFTLGVVAGTLNSFLTNNQSNELEQLHKFLNEQLRVLFGNNNTEFNNKNHEF